jgi:hypothetical protein
MKNIQLTTLQTFTRELTLSEEEVILCDGVFISRLTLKFFEVQEFFERWLVKKRFEAEKLEDRKKFFRDPYGYWRKHNETRINFRHPSDLQ